MSLSRVLAIVWANITRNKRSFVLSSIGLIVGVATLTFFVSLGMGIQDGVLNKIYPVNQIEVEPKTVGIVGIREDVIDKTRLGPEMVDRLGTLPGVTAVYPKIRSKLQARLWGGKALFGYAARAEAFFDGLDPALLSSELARNERVDDKRSRAGLRKPVKCLSDEECPLGKRCGEAGVCGDIEYWKRFGDHGTAVPCAGDDARFCPSGMGCAAGVCQPLCEGATGTCSDNAACVPPANCESDECPGVCAQTCQVDGDCPSAFTCDTSPNGPKVCRRIRCELASPNAQFSERLRDQAGRVLGKCANGVAWNSPACEPLTCPSDTYCAPLSVQRKDGFCEAPVPVVLSPVLIELFNSSAASSLNMQPIDGTDAMMGFQFRFHFGDSYFAGDLPKESQAVKRAEIVGFSDKALEFGVTMPTDYVRAINARYKGRGAAETFDTFILETEGNEDVSELITELDTWGFSLARKSEDARKAADLLFILTVVFSFISVVIMVVAAVNIMHTFLTLITERRYEIGIMRAVGATRGDIRKMILLEATILGVFGGIVGNILAYGFSRTVNWAAAEYLEGIPFKPEEFFVFDWRVIVGGVLFAWLFCLIGALLPANKAARLDPAVVLTS